MSSIYIYIYIYDISTLRVNHKNYEEWGLFKSNLFRVVLDQSFTSYFFPLACRCHNTKHVHVPLPTAYINAYFQDTGLTGRLVVETSNFSAATFLI
jgi:hypothetical protein